MKAHVNELLLYSRLPFHFWTELNGGRWPFDNPGCSVLSLCAHKLNQQMITVPDEMLSSLEECRVFTMNATTVFAIMQWIEATSEALVVKASALSERKAVFQELTHLLGSIKNLRTMVSTIFSGVLFAFATSALAAPQLRLHQRPRPRRSPYTAPSSTCSTASKLTST